MKNPIYILCSNILENLGFAEALETKEKKRAMQMLQLKLQLFRKFLTKAHSAPNSSPLLYFFDFF